MEKKNNNIVIILMGIIIVILVVLCVLLATGKISSKVVSDVKKSGDVIEENNEESISIDNIIESNDTSDKNFYNVNELEVKTLDDYSMFSDISNNNNSVEFIKINDNYSADLKLSGDVEITTYTSESLYSGTLKIEKVVDIIQFNIVGVNSEQLLYMLTENGDVYSYKVGESNSKNYNVVKVDNVSKVKKLFISQYSKENAGGSWAIFAITESNECIMLKAASV